MFIIGLCLLLSIVPIYLGFGIYLILRYMHGDAGMAILAWLFFFWLCAFAPCGLIFSLVSLFRHFHYGLPLW